MAAASQIRAQLAIVVNLAIQNRPNRLIFVGDRLPPVLQIDNAEPPHADSARAFDVISLVIGTAVANLAAHSADVRGFHVPSKQELPRYAAHRPQTAS